MRHRVLRTIVQGQQTVSADAGTSVRKAAQMMAERHVGAILVCNADDSLAGIFTERDVLNRVVARGLDPDVTLLGEVMTSRPQVSRPTERAVDTLLRMRDGGFRHMPVVEGSRLLGVVSLRDFVGAELQLVEEELQFMDQIAEGTTS